MYNFLKSLVKWPLVVGLSAYIGYKSHNSLEKITEKMHYSGVKAEKGFVGKRSSLKSRVCREKNERGNLETYLCVNGNRIPVLQRENGLMCGDADYNFRNFTQQEIDRLCPKNTYKEDDEDNEKGSFIWGILEGLYEFIFD